jgi:hypothetical protein
VCQPNSRSRPRRLEILTGRQEEGPCGHIVVTNRAESLNELGRETALPAESGGRFTPGDDSCPWLERAVNRHPKDHRVRRVDDRSAGVAWRTLVSLALAATASYPDDPTPKRPGL